MSARNIAVSQLLLECYELVAVLLEFLGVIEEMSLLAPSSTSLSVVSCVSMNDFISVSIYMYAALMFFTKVLMSELFFESKELIAPLVKTLQVGAGFK